MTAATPPDPSPPSVDGFLKAILRSGLLDSAQVEQAVRSAPPDHRQDAKKLADFLVRAGKLSRFQAKKLLKGTSLGLVMGPYQILAPIGKGGMGVVYMARDQRNGRLTALKVLPPRRARAEERMLARFQREMDISRRVAHPHVALTYESGQLRGVYYIAMEYIPGQTLSRLVTGEGPLKPARAARLFAEVASGLEHAHEQGLIHRDLKPANLMVTPHDHAKVLDLGLALMQGEVITDHQIVGGQGYIVGSMDYIAPEQTTDASKVDRRSDVYGLGCCLYYALAGQPPFPGGSNLEKIQRHRSQEPTSLLQLKPTLPPGFVQIVRKMMAKDPARRHPSARAVEEDLLPWATGEAVQPLDRPDDSDFLAAVATLKDADPSTDLSLTNLGAVDWKRTTAADAPSPGGAERQEEILRRLRRPPLWLLAVLVGLAAMLLIEIVLLGAAAAGLFRK